VFRVKGIWYNQRHLKHTQRHTHAYIVQECKQEIDSFLLCVTIVSCCTLKKTTM